MGQLNTAVAYDGLPIASGGAHGLGRIAARDALAAWLSFLEVCTEAGPIKCYFDFPHTPELTVDPAVVSIIDEAFGGGPGRRTVSFDRSGEAIALLESLEPLPTNRYGMAPVWLWFTADFRLRKPDDDALWPGQDPDLFGHFQTPGGITLGASSTRLILQAKRFLGLSLTIPEATDDDLIRHRAVSGIGDARV